MLRVEPSRHQIAIAGQVIDKQTRRGLQGAEVKMISAPDEFVRSLTIRARQVRFENPALESRRPVVGDPNASPAEILTAAQDILVDLKAGIAARINAARTILDHAEATGEDRFTAAQFILDRQQRRPNNGKRLDLAHTPAGGAFYFLDLPDGAYRLRATLPGMGSRYGATEAQVEVPPALTGDDRREQTIEFELPPTTLRGRVIDQDTESGVAMAEVRVVGSREFAFSKIDSPATSSDDALRGAFMLIALEAGKRTLRVSARGYAIPAEPITVTLVQGEVTSMNDIQLVRQG